MEESRTYQSLSHNYIQQSSKLSITERLEFLEEYRLVVSESVFKEKLKRIQKAWNFVNPDKQRESLDIVLTEDIRSCSTTEAQSDFGIITVIGFDDLIRMKSQTGRRQDEEDVRALKSLKDN
jgi:hypothetical protein